MEKFNNLAIVVHLRSFLRSGENTKGMSVYLLWRLVLAASFASAVAIATLAWISYDWAIKETELQFSRPTREVFSIDELHEVIDMYKEKERDHGALKLVRPSAPPLEAGIIPPASVES